MRVEVQPYNPQWPEDFLEIKGELLKTLKGVDAVSIEHVGSTSVPGLAAKPVIDVDIIVEAWKFKAASDVLVKAGGYENMGDWGVKDRVAFRKPAAVPKRNVYVCLEGCVGLRNHLALRDICRADASIRDAYGKAKQTLATHEWADTNEYCMAKNDIIQWILGRAGLSEQDLKEIAFQNEG